MGLVSFSPRFANAGVAFNQTLKAKELLGLGKRHHSLLSNGFSVVRVTGNLYFIMDHQKLFPIVSMY
jgi:hypothetical protein